AGAHLLPLARAGIAFMDGVQQEGKVNRTKAKAAYHVTATSITYLAIDHRLPQVLQQRLRVHQVARGEAFGEPGVERREEGAGGVALTLALPEPRQASGGAQLERLGLLPTCDLQGVAEERLRLLDRIAVGVEENL